MDPADFIFVCLCVASAAALGQIVIAIIWWRNNKL